MAINLIVYLVGWHNVNGDEVAAIQSHDGRAVALALSADNKRLITAMDCGTVLVWDLETANARCPLTTRTPHSSVAAFSALKGRDRIAQRNALEKGFTHEVGSPERAT